jgi:hypothetical protein
MAHRSHAPQHPGTGPIADRTGTSMKAAPESPAPRGIVVAHGLEDRDPATDHEAATLLHVAGRLAALKGFDLADPAHEAPLRHPGPVYLVPPATIVGVQEAARLGVRSDDDLFGGVVPHAFVATKSITHPAVSPQARTPEGWSHAFASRVGDSVLAGFSAFSRDDARDAGFRLLPLGPVRVKRVLATGGHGQSVVASGVELERLLDDIDEAEMEAVGLVLEQDLVDVTTFSFGTTRIGAWRVAYHGTQRLTPDNRGEPVYGGSDLLVARGGADALLRLDLDDDVRVAIEGARVYDAAVGRCFPGFFASRRNYDIVFGRDAGGRRRHGVLEQSWRIGGASGAEVAALEAFRDDPALDVVRAATVEVFGESPPPPAGAVVCFRGVDARAGALTKYTVVRPDER